MAKAKRTNPPLDQVYRKRIAEDLRTTLLVEAAAGTGKTTCLIARMVNLLRAGCCRIETLAAVTFTRKAAAELRTRFQLALELAASEASGEERRRLLEAVDHIEGCFLGTIHAFCARLLRERPVEARIDPAFVELNESHDAQLRHEAWREHVASLISSDAPVLAELQQLGLKISPSTRRSQSITTELDELGLEPAELGPAFLQYAEFADIDDWPAVPVPLPDLQPCLRELREYLAHIQALSLPERYGNDKLLPKYELIGRMARGLDLTQPAQLFELLEQFRGEARVVQKEWPGKKAQALAEKERWEVFVEKYAEPLLLAWREHRYEPVMRAIRPARDVYDRLRRERNALNFQDLLLRAAALLRGQPEVRRYFRDRFTHLLVDEFQDTDPIQAEVMLLLTADDPEETNWQQCRAVPGSLFVVGDPKQSIYRFRRADIQIYNKVRSIVEQAGGDVVPLTANFRSVQPIIEWVNSCFSELFPATADDFSPADRPLERGRAERGRGGGSADEADDDDSIGAESAIQRLSVPAGIKAADEIAEFEADLIARTVRRAVDERRRLPRTEAERELRLPDHVTPGDFLIVSRVKQRLTVYARKLQQYGIPHSVTGGSVLNQVPELALLYLCLRAVARSDDPVALVAVLRSELFGVADTVLYDYRRLGGQFSFYATMPEQLPEPAAAEIRSAFERLRQYARWLRRMPTVAAVERMAADLGLIARACATEDGDAHAGSLLKAMELLRAADRQLTVGDYVVALGRLVGREELHDGVTVRPPQEAPVRVMNLHQCKGLEAPIVFLVDPSGEKDHGVGIHIDRSGDRPRGFLAVYGPKRSKYQPPPVLAQPPGWQQLADREQRFLDGEANRLLYVAATRAGVKLVISQREDGNYKNPWQLFDRHLREAESLADPGQGTLPAATLQIDQADWQRQVEAIDQRWRRVVRPTYNVQAVKALVLTGQDKPHGADAGGLEWGEVLHGLLEAAMVRPPADLSGLAISALEAVGLPLDRLDDALATVERVVASPLWQRALRADRSLAEVPLAVPLAVPLVSGASESGLPTVLRGIIDLAFREPAGWVLVDYKSERVGSEDIPALVDYYRAQIEAYATAWERAVGQAVVERGLLFTQRGEYVRV